MQKQSKIPPLAFEPVPLAAEFPLAYSGPYALPREDVGSLHLHDCLEIGWCESGAGEFYVDDKVMAFSAGDCSAVNAREFHRARSTGAECARWHFIQFSPAFLLGGHEGETEFFSGRRLGGADFVNVVSGRAHPEIPAQMALLVRELRERAPGWRLAAAALLRWLLIGFARTAGGARPDGGAAPRTATHQDMERLAPAVALINRDYASPLRIEDLAAACCVSVPHFRRLFQAAFRKSPGQYLQRFRMQMGAHLLRDGGAGVLEAALAVGYASASTFHRHYKALFGTAPRAGKHQRRP